MKIKFKKAAFALAGLAVVTGIALASGKLLMQPPQPTQPLLEQVENADMVKKAIAEQFASAPQTFDLPKASKRLSDASVDGYAVCSGADEATSGQYVEVSAMLDKVKSHGPEFKKVVDHVMDSPKGMSDCDFRVISAIGRVAVGG